MAAQSQFSLSWEAHKNNVCTGLSSLQQNGEFVDMTLAADGHHVKVHQVIMALASPYIKELIATAHNPHPIIFLNKISYTTLSSILEYIYTGEVLVAIENLAQLIEAGKELHIKGLEDMNYDLNLTSAVKKLRQMKRYDKPPVAPVPQQTEDVDDDNEYCYFEITDSKDAVKFDSVYDTANTMETTEVQEQNQLIEAVMEEQTYDETMQEPEETITDDVELSESELLTAKSTPPTAIYKRDKTDVNVMQYTVSNQGSLQLVLNRFVYYLKHTKRDGQRQWRCVDYLSGSRCPAAVVTTEDVVVRRIKAHTHNFHDKKILKKVQAGAIFTAINEAIREGENKKSEHANTKTVVVSVDVKSV